MSSATLSNPAIDAAVFNFLRRNSIPSARKAVSAASSQNVRRDNPGGFQGKRRTGGAAEGMELTCTVSWSVTLPLAGSVGEAGLKVQVVPVGRLGH